MGTAICGRKGTLLMTIIRKGEPMSDLISRQEAIEGLDVGTEVLRRVLDEVDVVGVERAKYEWGLGLIESCIADVKGLPSAQPEPLTDKEQRIFLAAMGREMKVCQEVDRNYTREPYEDSLVRVCREIERKVKGALWTT
jgi:hypothetical protein